jgi:hypothetical protein
MPKRTLNYYLIKTTRLTGWFLLPLVILYIGTGFVLCGKLGFDNLLDTRTALVIHQIFDWPLVVLFSVHATATTYIAMRRWGWIGRKRHR